MIVGRMKRMLSTDMSRCIEEVGKELLPLTVQSHVALLFYVHGKHLRSCRDGQLT